MDKLKIIDQLIAHLSDSQGMDLKALLDESKAPKEAEVCGCGEPECEKCTASVEALGEPKEKGFDEQADEAISAESEKPGMELDPGKDSAVPGEEEMTDDELEELLGKYLK